MLNSIIDEVIVSFSEAGFPEEEARLKGYKEGLSSNDPAVSLSAAENIIGFCHAKAWGDLNVAGRSSRYEGTNEWDDALDELRKTTRQYIRKKISP